MEIARRGRRVSVLGYLIAGGVGVISSTQTWLTVHRVDAGEPLLVAGADAVPLLAPLSLALLALGAALAIAGIVLRYAFAVLGAGAAVVLTASTVPLLASPPPSAVAAAVTEATGIAGAAAVDDIVERIAPSAWPTIALICWIVLLAASAFIIATARGWKAGGRRYRAGTSTAGHPVGPLDAVDSWDDLSHGTDPTAR